MFLSVLLNDDSCMKRAARNGNQVYAGTQVTEVPDYELPVVQPYCGNGVSKHKISWKYKLSKENSTCLWFCNSIESARLSEAQRGSARPADVESETERLRSRVTKFLLSAAREITWKLYCPWIFHFFICYFRHPSRSSVSGDANCTYACSNLVPFTLVYIADEKLHVTFLLRFLGWVENAHREGPLVEEGAVSAGQSRVCAAHAASRRRLRHFPACDTLPAGECEAAREFRAQRVAQRLSVTRFRLSPRLSLKLNPAWCTVVHCNPGRWCGAWWFERGVRRGGAAGRGRRASGARSAAAPSVAPHWKVKVSGAGRGGTFLPLSLPWFIPRVKVASRTPARVLRLSPLPQRSRSARSRRARLYRERASQRLICMRYYLLTCHFHPM